MVTDGVNPPSSNDDDLPRPPAGRRASSRPAGPPAPSPVQRPAAAPAAPGSDDEGLRKAVSGALASPFAAPAVLSPSDTEAALADLSKAVASSVEDAEPAPKRRSRPRKAAEADGEGEGEKKPARRARRKKSEDRAKPAEVEAAPAAKDDEPAKPADEATGEAVEEAPARKRSRSRRRGKQADEQSKQADEQTDESADKSTVEEPQAEAEATETSGEDVSGEGDEPGEGQSRSRRRRRGGRRRRRSKDDDENSSDDEASEETSGESASEDSSDAADVDSDDSEDSSDSDGDDEGGSRRRRRRRRRRRGSDSGSDDADVEVVERPREARRRRAAKDQITGIEGSTRMEAKRQRRREGRSSGRRRAPVLSEAEFLSRRESVDREMLIRQAEDYTQIAVIEDKVLVEHYVDRKSSASLIGNIYLGRVQNVLPSMEAAFIDIGRGRNAVLYAGEVDWAAQGAQGADRKVESVFKSGQSVLVQVTKDPVGAKGARLTNHISIPGRYLVYAPGGDLSGISRKLPDTERQRLKSILDKLIDSKSSVIVRTAAEGVSEDELVRDVNRLTAQWEAIEKKAKQTGPQLLYSEPDPTVRIVRDLFTEDFSTLTVSGNGGADDAADTIEAYVEHVAPHLSDRMKRWDSSNGDVFAKHRLDEQIAKALERKVFLPSGGSLIIDRTEAMTVIDVNTGKFTGRGGNLEATVTSNNLEAAEEIVRQLRLRDIGGIIVIDFIDMVLSSNRELLLRRLVECLARDRTRHQVSEVTSLGLVQLTRKKLGTGLHEAFTETCEECKGLGYQRHETPVATQAPSDGGERKSKRGRGAAKSGGGSKSGGGRKKSAAKGDGNGKADDKATADNSTKVADAPRPEPAQGSPVDTTAGEQGSDNS